jgi:hypothetical protein
MSQLLPFLGTGQSLEVEMLSKGKKYRMNQTKEKGKI